jgi:diguanylate cyclase (GGDEF)-like protein/PAS domain S-box-containing protein
MSTATILVTEDNFEISYFLAKKLLPSFGYNTIQAATGKESLEMIRSCRPDLVMLDLQLPDMDGIDVLRKLANEGRSIPTILMTAHGSEQIAIDAFRLGVRDYLTKPINPDTLKLSLTQILSEKRMQEEKARLTKQLEEQVGELKILSRVGQSLTSTLQINEVLRRIVEAGVYLTKAEEGFLALANGKSGELYLRASKNIEEKRTRTMHLLLNDTMVGEVVRTKRPIRTSVGTGGTRLKVSTGYLVSSLLHVPILSNGRALGVLSVDNRHNPYIFTDKDEAMLTSLADYAAIAIENANLYARSQKEIAERMRAEAALRESEERYSLAMKGTNDGIWDWDLTTHEVYYSPRWKSMLGYAEAEVGSSPDEWFGRVYPEDREQLKVAITAHLQSKELHFEHEHRMLHNDGSYRWVLTRGFAVMNGSGTPIRIAGSQSDITDRKLAEERLIHNAFYDTLTGLPNRALLMDRLKQAISRKKRWPEKTFSVLYLDLDHFKNVNDSLGHATGDQLLVAIAERLQENLRSTDTVARLGGDEFIVLLEEIQDTENADEIAQRILKDLSTPRFLNDHEVYVTASIGIIVGDMEYDDPEQLLRDADIAMYSAKAHGRARYEVFKLEMRNDFLEQLTLEYALRHAITQGELRLAYQPIISLKTGWLAGFEALVRWEHPVNGFLYPRDFIAIAEDTGLILAIDRWVLQHAMSQFREWLDVFPACHDLAISVNLSTKYLSQLNLVEEVEKILKRNNLEGRHLKLEITESGIMENSQHIRTMLEGLKGMGVDVHIDDFGTGYSSLAYLHQFPVQALKIDRSFLSNSESKKHMPEIVRTVVHLARDLKLDAIAEGVETQIQLDQLQGLGCEYGQGYFFSPPLDPESTVLILKKNEEGQTPFTIFKSNF